LEHIDENRELKGYNPDVELPEDKEEIKQQEVVVLSSRDEKNYIQEFYDKFGPILI
jgi:hypothetical protein